MTYGGFDMYLGSDAEGTNEAQAALVIGEYGLDRGVDVMLVDHHGSYTYGISSPSFIGALDPEAAIISVWPNAFQHPRRETVDNLWDVIDRGIPSIIRLNPGDDTPRTTPGRPRIRTRSATPATTTCTSGRTGATGRSRRFPWARTRSR